MTIQQRPAASDPSFRLGSRTPEELERYAALIVPIWDMPPEVPTGVSDPGFQVAPVSPSFAAAFAAPAAAPAVTAQPAPSLASTMIEVAPRQHVSAKGPQGT